MLLCVAGRGPSVRDERQNRSLITLCSEYALGDSPYNEFLFAAVGEEKAGVLTVLTALTRLGLDPWREAARLSDLPRETAARALAAKIAMLPEGDWKASESEAIAARLVGWLPDRSIEAIPSVEAERVGEPNALETRK